MSLIEPLESRIAPAAVVSFTDVDGDFVTIKTSKGTNSELSAAVMLFGGVASGDPYQIREIDLSSNSVFIGTDLSVTAKKGPQGDGLVNVGSIDASSADGGIAMDIGKVTIMGDLGQIDAGDGGLGFGNAGVNLLSVRSMGRYGLATQDGTGDLVSDIGGGLDVLKVTGDIEDAFIRIFGTNFALVGSVTIGGSLIGGLAPNSGSIQSTGGIGVVKIGRDVTGGAGEESGSIQAEAASIASVTIGGSLRGGGGDLSGLIRSSTDMGPVKIAGNVEGGSGITSGMIASRTGLGPDNGSIASITIGGSLLGGVGSESGLLRSAADMGPVKIARDVRGSAAAEAGKIDSGGLLTSLTVGGSVSGGTGGFISIPGSVGQIHADGRIGNVTIGGGLIGGGTASAAIVSNGAIGLVKIGRDLQGGTGGQSGYIESGAGIAGVTIGGSLLGGSGLDTGEIFCLGDLGPVTIAGDFVGGSVIGAASLTDSGYILSLGRIASISIGGSIIAGTDNSSGDLFHSASIRTNQDIGSLTVKGSIVGSVGFGGVTPVIISAQGQETPTATRDLAIGKIAVGGRVERAWFLAGYDRDMGANNGNASIGAVSVGGDWIASNLVAGVVGSGGGFGTAGDQLIITGSDAIIARIASVAIKGLVAGTSAAGDHFGFVAQQIGSFKAGGFTTKLTTATDAAVELSPITDDVTIREV